MRAEPEPCFLQGSRDDGEEPNHPADNPQLHTGWAIRDGWVVQRVANGHVAIMGHYSEGQKVGGPLGEVKERLGQALGQGHGLVSGQCGGDSMEGLQRKQYMGKWRQESRHGRTITARFPSTVSTFINRMKANRRLWNS